MSNRNALTILDSLPETVDGVAAWFGAMNHDEFDVVCASAITLMLDDEREEAGFVSTRSIAVLMTAMRDRYRQVVADAKLSGVDRGSGINHRSATINEMQARIIRRIPKGARGLGHVEIARVFGTSPMAVYKLRSGKTWKYLGRRVA